MVPHFCNKNENILFLLTVLSHVVAWVSSCDFVDSPRVSRSFDEDDIERSKQWESEPARYMLKCLVSGATSHVKS